MPEKSSLQPSESIISALRSLYDSYGYSRYKMNKFEEYDLYARNKDFLVSDSVITFTDTNGRLMALKPDVTLSIVKNTRDMPESVQKLYYNEYVYRVSKGSRTFREIMQVGLECLGNIDDYRIYEVLRLAQKSLKAIGRRCVLDISHLGLVSDVIDSIGVPSDEKAGVLRLIGEKNLHELSEKCALLGIPEEKSGVLKRLAAVNGTPDRVLPELEALLAGRVGAKTLAQFVRIVSALSCSDEKEYIRIDFSVVDDIHYYNGFVFKGFAEGVPNSVLSGGQYDKLMRKMKRRSGAVGFAVYLDALEQLNGAPEEYDADAVLLYDDDTPLAEIGSLAESLAAKGGTVSVQRTLSPDARYGRLIKLEKGEVKTIENNA